MTDPRIAQLAKNLVNFSVEVKPGDICTLMLYKKGAKEPEEKLDLPEKDAVGNVRFLALPKSKLKGKEYHYEINGKAVVDLCSTSIVEYDNNDVRATVLAEDYDWEGDKPLEIPYSDVIAYSLHVRGFTKHKTSKVKKKGTFKGNETFKGDKNYNKITKKVKIKVK